MTDKPVWMENLAWEIDVQYATWEQEDMGGDPTSTADRLIAIIALILKHCPEDKGVGKLVEALQLCVTEFERIDKKTCYSEREPEWWVAWSQVCRKLRAALADHEKVKK